MFHIVLYQPRIPPNTGNVMRLCANTGAHLHLIRPLGFELSERRVRRAGLDYLDWASVREHPDLDDFLAGVDPERVFAVSTRGRRAHTSVEYRAGDALLFGPETCGLPTALLDSFPAAHILRVPMVPGSRSLNLSNAVAVVLYEAWRQTAFAGASEVAPRA